MSTTKKTTSTLDTPAAEPAEPAEGTGLEAATTTPAPEPEPVGAEPAPLDDVETITRAIHEHWRDAHTAEPLGFERMLARAALGALRASHGEAGGERSSIGDVIALVLLSLLGLVFWLAVAGTSQNVAKIREALDRPSTRYSRITMGILWWGAFLAVILPWLLMFLAIARRVLP